MAPIKKSTLFLGVVILAGLVAAVKYFMPSKTVSEPMMVTMAMDTTNTTSSKSEERMMEAPMMMNKDVKKVSVSTSYSNPSGKDDVQFSLWIDSMGTIVDAKVEVLATNETSKKRQTAFAEGLPMAIKGKKLSLLTAIDKVGGSSLTTKAFNDSIDALKAGL